MSSGKDVAFSGEDILGDELLREPSSSRRSGRMSRLSSNTDSSAPDEDDDFDVGDDGRPSSTAGSDSRQSSRLSKAINTKSRIQIGSSALAFNADMTIDGSSPRDSSARPTTTQTTASSGLGDSFLLSSSEKRDSVLITELDEPATIDLGKSGGRVSFQARAVQSKQLRLPSVINLVALKESLLSEAPFIVEGNKSFWRRMLNNKNFHEILCYTYYFIASCISDMAVVDLEKLANAKQAEYIKELPVHLTTMHMTISLKERDALFNRFPEALTYLLLNAMRVAVPKHARLYGVSSFREILLGWCTEIIYGMRLTNTRVGREWLFRDAIDGLIMTNPPTEYNPNVSAPTGCVKRRIEIKNSPLVEMFISPMKLPSTEKPLILTLSEIPSKDLVTLMEDDGRRSHIAKVVKKRMDVVDHNTVNETLSRVNKSRRNRLDTLRRSKTDLMRDMSKMRESLSLDLLILKNNKKTALLNRDLSDVEKKEG